MFVLIRTPLLLYNDIVSAAADHQKTIKRTQSVYCTDDDECYDVYVSDVQNVDAFTSIQFQILTADLLLAYASIRKKTTLKKLLQRLETHDVTENVCLLWPTALKDVISAGCLCIIYI